MMLYIYNSWLLTREYRDLPITEDWNPVDTFLHNIHVPVRLT